MNVTLYKMGSGRVEDFFNSKGEPREIWSLQSKTRSWFVSNGTQTVLVVFFKVSLSARDLSENGFYDIL